MGAEFPALRPRLLLPIALIRAEVSGRPPLLSIWTVPHRAGRCGAYRGPAEGTGEPEPQAAPGGRNVLRASSRDEPRHWYRANQRSHDPRGGAVMAGVKDQTVTERYAVFNGDCVEVMKSLPDASVHLSVYSPPFGGLYNYSSDERDLSNCTDYAAFFEHYEFVVRELFRLTLPGRISAVHCMDVPSGNTGSDHYLDFPGDIIRLHDRIGFKFIARHAIWKEPLWVRNRTLQKNLAHKTAVDDSTECGVASADYLMIFRRIGENAVPVSNPVGFLEYAGDRSEEH